MGRPKKNKDEIPKIEIPKELVEITVKIKENDTDGNKILNSYESKGETVEEALKGFSLPTVFGITKITVKKGLKENTVALAPYRIRAIFTDKNLEVFKQAFGEF